jgi:hypothetical protein
VNRNFKLWNLSLDDDRLGCSFDVTRLQQYLLNEGTPEAIGRFLAALDVQAAVERWTLEPFCSPYFASEPIPKDWCVRFPMAWRVRVRFQGGYDKPISYRTGPVISDARDVTGSTSMDPIHWQYRKRQAIVVGDVFDRTPSSVDLRVEGLQKVEWTRPHPRVNQAHLDFGQMSFPQDSDRLDELVVKCAGLGMSVHWGDTVIAAGDLSLTPA